MAYYSGFQTSGYQRNAYQIVTSSVAPADERVLPGAYKGPYIRPYEKQREIEYQQRKIAAERSKLQEVEKKLAEAAQRQEEKRLEQLKLKKKAAERLAIIQATLEEEIVQLRILRAGMIQRINEEEGLLVLMLAAKRRLRAVH